MDKKTVHFLLSAAALFAPALAANAEILLPDPTIYAEDGTYYLTGTGDDANGAFPVYESKDLDQWKKIGNAVDAKNLSGDKWFWAPQIFKHVGKYKIAYCAFDERGKKHFLAVAESDRPDGGFKNSKILKSDANFEIDPFIFADDDGRVFAYFVHWKGKFGGICVQELSSDITKRVGAIKTLLKTDRDWERKPLPKEFKELNKNIEGEWEKFHASRATAEGPTVIKRKGKYVLFYSANDFRSPDYCIGVAVADSPLGEFKKLQDAPVISREITGFNGSGHGDIFFDNNGGIWYVFHAHHSNIRVSPRRTAIIKLIETFDSDGNPHYKADYSTMRLL